MYYLAFDLTKNKYTSLLSSIIYLLTPYRMGDMIVRSSYNEIFIFLFFPMILLSLNRLINNKKYLVLFVVSYSGLILSHLVMSLYATLFIVIWALFFYKQLFQTNLWRKNHQALFGCGIHLPQPGRNPGHRGLRLLLFFRFRRVRLVHLRAD